MATKDWHDKISNVAQLGGIETSVLDNGAGRGTRIAWINTGAGLRFKVVLDRAMDIADASYHQHSLAWLSHAGVTSLQPFSDRGANWLQTFGGGLLTTCGLTHVGAPEADVFGERGLHDRISNLPAEIESILQPDPLMGKMEMHITGKIKQTQALGHRLELKRTISAVLGEPVIRIHDEVSNRGNNAAPHMMLYHFNFGWPLVNDGSSLHWNGNFQAGENELSKRIFREENDFRRCPGILDEHNGNGEAVCFIDVSEDVSGNCICGIHNEKLGLAVSLSFKKQQLPWLTNWQHWGKSEFVAGLEPGTNPPIGQNKARQQNTLIFLQPGQTYTYDLKLEVLTQPDEIEKLVARTKHIPKTPTI